jgi:hypothetical protein
MNVPDPQNVLDRLEVVWMWQLKKNEVPFHEVCIIETVDLLDKNKRRGFVLDRVYEPDPSVVPNEIAEV